MAPGNSRDRGRGQIVVMVAGGAITLILVIGLVVDAGVAFFNRRDGQNAADLMALAGAKFVADDHRGELQADPSITTTHAALSRAAAANGCDAGGDVPCTWRAWFVVGGADGPIDLTGPDDPLESTASVPDDAIGVRVAVNREPSTFVLGVIGLNSWDVRTQAVATAEKLTMAPAGQLLPIGIKRAWNDPDPPTTYQPGQVYDLTDGKDLPGGFGWLTWGGNPDSTVLAASLCTPNNPPFSLAVPGTIIRGSSGKLTDPAVRDCLDEWRVSGQTVLVPIYSETTGSGANAEYRVVGVTAFVVTTLEEAAGDNIRGYFVEIFAANPFPAASGAEPPGAGDTSYALTLVK